MPRLYLLRHAKSSWDDPALDDHDRPLASRGKRAAKLIRSHLSEAGIAPELVLCSSAKRARQTLAGVESGLGDSAQVRVDQALYTFSADDLLGEIQAIDSEIDSAMLIGHNPAMQELALCLCGGSARLESVARKYPTAALATLEFDCPWAELGAATAALVGFVKPRELVDAG